jgi:hypothetical protein
VDASTMVAAAAAARHVVQRISGVQGTSTVEVLRCEFLYGMGGSIVQILNEDGTYNKKRIFRSQDKVLRTKKLVNDWKTGRALLSQDLVESSIRSLPPMPLTSCG